MNNSSSVYSGPIAKWIRAVLSLVIIVLSIVKHMWPMALIGLAFLLSAFMGTCPITLRFGKRRPDEKEEKKEI